MVKYRQLRKVHKKGEIKMMTINEVMAMVKEYDAERIAVKKVPHYYKRNGKMIERPYPDYVYSDRYHELSKILDSDEARVFKCSECGEMVTYFELETWICDVEEGEYTCSCCYEDCMGEDL